MPSDPPPRNALLAKALLGNPPAPDNFVIRVELHGAEDDKLAYGRLHTAMGNYGFQRMIASADGRYYHLPTATYAFMREQGMYTSAAVRDLVAAVVAPLGFRHWIIVTKGDSAWTLPAVHE